MGKIINIRQLGGTVFLEYCSWQTLFLEYCSWKTVPGKTVPQTVMGNLAGESFAGFVMIFIIFSSEKFSSREEEQLSCAPGFV